MNDSLGDRMEKRYENRTRIYLPRRTYTILRLDGKSFHTYTRSMRANGMDTFNKRLASCFNFAAIELCKQAQGSEFAYLQSDEVSILLTDFRDIRTDAWFDGNLQKIVSVSASIFTQAFNRAAVERFFSPIAVFDVRVFTIADKVEVANYFIWRQKDWERNSIQMLARDHFSHKALRNKKSQDIHDMLHEKEINWNDLPVWCKRGRVVEYDQKLGDYKVDDNIPVFTQDKDYLGKRIPDMWPASGPTGPQGETSGVRETECNPSGADNSRPDGIPRHCETQEREYLLP